MGVPWELLLSLERKARVWIDTTPPTAQSAGTQRTRTRQFAATRHAPAGPSSAAVELFVPLGARCMYGLLGAELLGGARPTLDVIASVGTGAGLYEQSLARAMDDVHFGLPDEYADAVLNGARAAFSYQAPSATVVRFGVAAHGAASSSQVMFERLARIVCGLLLASSTEIEALPATLQRLLDVAVLEIA